MVLPTTIPIPATPFLDQRTGAVSRAWYLFFQNLFLLTGGGQNTITLEDLQLGPVSDALAEMAALFQSDELGVAPGAETSNAALQAMFGALLNEPAELDWMPLDNRIGALEIAPVAPVTSSAAFGALIGNIRTVTSAPVILADDYTLLVDATSAPITAALPAAPGMAKRILNIKKIDASANAVTIDPNGSELIDGAATFAITTQNQNAQIQCDGAAWWVL